MPENAKSSVNTAPIYPIVSPAMFNLNKDSYVNQVFYCPRCDEHYCFGYNHVDAKCGSCFWIEQVKGACLKMYGDAEMRMIPKQKPCMACLAKEQESLSYLVERAAEKRKAKARKASFRKPAKERRLKRREEKRTKQREKSATILPFAEPVTAEEATKFSKRCKRFSSNTRSIFKKKLKRFGPRTGCLPWQQSPSMRYAC